MIIHRISVEGFKIIANKLDLTLPESGRIGIQGVNESGKSTLLESVEFVLYGPKRGGQVTKEDVITWGKGKARFLLEFSTGSRRFLLRRELNSKGQHKAVLTPIMEGNEDKKNAITNLTEIQNTIETMTGMDRESFSKLIYIKQKDLDALRELAKAKREQLVNKIMGIDIFDEAIKLAKDNDKTADDELSKITIKMDSVKRNKESYEKKLKEKAGLSGEVNQSGPLLTELESKVEAAKGRLDAFDWASKKKTLDDLIESKRAEHKGVREKASDLSRLRQQLVTNDAGIAKYGDQVKTLSELHKNFESVEQTQQEREVEVLKLQTRRIELMKKKGLSESVNIEDLTKAKDRLNKRFILSVIAGIGVLFVSLLFLPILVASLGLFVLSAVWWTRLRKLDKVIGSLSELQSLSHQIRDSTSGVMEAEAKRNQVQVSSHFESSDAVKESLGSLLTEVKNLTGQDTFEGLSAITKELRERVEVLEKSEPEKRESELQCALIDLGKDLASHLENPPLGATNLAYDEKAHTEAKEDYEVAVRGTNDLKIELDTNKKLIAKLEDDLNALKADYVAWPELEKGFNELSHKVQVLGRTVHELSETAKELRNRVIPQAKIVISKILPKLTNGRYSDFEIEEDLTFTVNSASGYRAREIFSGGTQDQFLIALRLAFTRSILDSRIAADKYCLLMDECIASSDEFRRQGIFDVLDLMKDTFSQILVIAHEDISNFVDYHMILSRDSNGFTSVKKRW